MSNYKRTVEDAIEMIKHAKHKEADVLHTTQVFYYPSASDTLEAQEMYTLFDLDEEFIEQLENGVDLIFKGDESEKLVLCTEDATFEVKEGEISNSLMVLQDLQNASHIITNTGVERNISEVKVHAIFNKYIEIRPTFPRVSKLRQLLTVNFYKGEDEEENSNEAGYYLCELLDKIQCSRQELIQELNSLRACCIQGRWRLLDIQYESRMLSLLINLMEDQSWNCVPKKESQRVLQSLMPDYIFNHLVTHYSQPDSLDDDKLSLVEKPVSVCFAEMILRAGEGKFRHNEFIMAWNHCLPPGMTASLDNLRGLALVEEESSQQSVIHLFPEYSLPENVAERFRLLFKRKAKWTLDDIEPYIRKLATSKVNVNSMLTKHSRACTLNGVRVFGARYTQ